MMGRWMIGRKSIGDEFTGLSIRESNGSQICEATDGYEYDAIEKLVEQHNQEITQQWLPIETAPQDGTPILACSWHPTLPHLYIPITAYWANYHPNAKGDECWRTSTIGGNKLRGLTHWMPLPAVPQSDKGE